MKIKHIILLVLSVTIVTACVQKDLVRHSKSMAKKHSINLLVSGNGGGADLSVSTGAMNACGRGAPNGCMVFERDEKGKISFSMSGNDAGFHITQLKICKGAAAPSPKDKDCNLSIPNALDFYVEPSSGWPRVPVSGTGKIEWSYAQGVKTFIIFNQNRLEQQYYYSVIACDGPKLDPDDPTSVEPNCIDTDPAMDNKGIH